MGYDRKYLISGLIYATVGLALGIYMGIAQNHGQFVTHAHIMLVGFVISFLYGVVHKLWLDGSAGALAAVQFLIHHVSTLVMLIGLFLMFGHLASEEQAGPVMGIASIGVLIGMLLMIVMVLRAPASKAATAA